VIDHVILNVRDVPASRGFYVEALAPLGYEVMMDFPTGVGFGWQGKPYFWIAARDPRHSGVHVAFHCKKRELVDAFYAAAIAAGGKDNGEPGIREGYHPNYYGAFVLDPDGNNIEAVCHEAMK
jgi:catechol 2,3-dioxygenase-like lactoylglutathione lyase family enzyme